MLHAIEVSFAYRSGGPSVVDGVSLAIGRGDLVGLLGPNGSGKTTILRLLGGMLRPRHGSIAFEGRRLADWPRREAARKIAYVPQETRAPFDFSVMEIVLMGRFPHLGPFALEGPADLAVARQALDATGMTAFSSRLFHTLSGGEKQRVVIASALAQEPELLLLDEPTASLDVGHQLEVQQLLSRLNAGGRVAMVLSTHDLNFAASLCRRLILVRNGRVLASGPTEDVLTPAAVRALYDVDADVHMHQRAGHLTVTPIART
jgi:ABC-type cobalamin/Fe3+-siderophores transport system ATPase subunit